MDFETLFAKTSFAKTPATLDEIKAPVAYALERHPLCRSVQFDIVSMPRTSKGNWTISLQSVTPDALWEASDIVADIQEAYELAVPACLPGPPRRWCCAVGAADAAAAARLSLNYRPGSGQNH